MSDDLDDLRAALKAAPAPDGEAKVRAMALAMENFARLNDSLQGSTDASRSSEDRTKAAPLNGVRRMFQYLTSRPALAATTSVAALLLGVAVILPVADLRIGKPTVVVETNESPVAKKAEPVVEPAVKPEVAATTETVAADVPAGGEGAALTDAATQPGADAAPKPEARSLLPMYSPIRKRPPVKRIEVTAAPSQTSRHFTDTRGMIL